MTLKEWETKYWQVTLLHEGWSRWYAFDTCISGECRRELWNLSDYKVSSVVAGTIWLTQHSTRQDDENHQGRVSEGSTVSEEE